MGSKSTNVVKADFTPGRGKGGRPSNAALDSVKSMSKFTKEVLATSKPAKEMTKKEKKEVKRFDKEFKKLVKQTGADATDFRADVTQRAVYRSLMAAVMDIIPAAHAKYKESKSENAFYAFRSAAEQLQQLMSGIRTLESLEEQAEYVTNRIVSPALVQMVSAMLLNHQTAKARIDSMDLKREQKEVLHSLFDDSLKEHVLYVKEMQQALKFNIEGYLIGDA